LLLSFLPVLAASAATDVPEEIEREAEYVASMQRGIEAFRRGDRAEAARAFQDAYMYRPGNPEVQSWMQMVQEDQGRHEAMTRALERVKRCADEGRDQEGACAELGMAARQVASAEVNGAATPSRRGWFGIGDEPGAPGEGRREVLTGVKRAGYQRF
jgi:hypothetical protein